MSFDAEAFFGGKKHTQRNMRNTPDLDMFMGKDFGGFDMFGGQGASFGDDRNHNGFVDNLDFTQQRGRRIDEGLAYGIQNFGNTIRRSESNINKTDRILQLKKKRKLQAGIELAERNPQKYGSVSKAKDRLDNFEENRLRKKAGVHGTRFTPQGSYSNVKSNVKGMAGEIKNEVGYRVSKIKLANKIRKLNEINKIRQRQNEAQTGGNREREEISKPVIRRDDRLE